ncbi:cytochrome c oxidase cbb3-type subunit 3 [Cupriavidus sp. OV038]|jgi:cytochrome c oxidase cbb3-type subunit 3|uniref:c-type cytochrome n=1 Tax=unclassified Cupriavidus TaxID=2640874 RepID=UPI0008DF28C4|nr:MULTISPECIES: cytochrome c [unclassified Cupriavidus]SFD05700.1 cytochrome c oxidase cbb3-type subunit 3 [Cupriavidus sp. OV038]SFP72104.1 cytochrome c oxidase cbb3-type subunit 3 [Cupriavidus sp. OV096]
MRRQTTFLMLAPLLVAAGINRAHADDQFAHSTRLYNTYCVQCHGVNRDGNGVNSRDMAVKPRDHTDTKAMGDTPDETLLKAIKGGGLAVGKSVLMPKWEGLLTDDDMKEMVSYLRFVSKTGTK